LGQNNPLPQAPPRYLERILENGLHLPHQPGPAITRNAPTDFVKIVLDAVQKYEKVPNRKEMIHDQMYHHMLRLYKKYVQTDPDSLITSLCEWMCLGRYVGFRREE
jgi:hypothetical protein